MREAVMFVHGIWMTGWEMVPLQRRVAHHGYDCYRFRYRSLRHAPQLNAARLNERLQTIDAEIIHLVAHSLGGLVVMHLLEQFPLQKPGRIVMLGTPLAGSAVAANLDRSSLTRWLLGRSIERGLLGGAPRWKGARELGMIAGSKAIGVGRVLAAGRLRRPHDGMVTVAETRAPGIGAHLIVPHTHTSMLFSKMVAANVDRFLRAGRFVD